MIYTLMLGVPVRTQDQEIGTLKRIIINNGVVNQFTVNPGLFGVERIVPISDIQQATAEHVVLNIADADWKAYGAFETKQHIVSDAAAAPGLMPVAPRLDTTSEVLDVPTAEATASDRSLEIMSVVLSHSTRVGNQGQLAGLVVDTGVPRQIVLEGGATILFAEVGTLDEERIQLGTAPSRMDGAIEPGTLGDGPGGRGNPTAEDSLGDHAPSVASSTDTRRSSTTD